MDADILSGPSAAVIEKGKELLKEYQVSYDQTIRFPYEGFYYQTHGAYALTSLEEARKKYPNWPIPETLGDYRFADLTLHVNRTGVVFPDVVPPPKDTIEVLDDRDPKQYYLCYQDDSSRFRIDVMLVYLIDDWNEIEFGQLDTWQPHPEVRFERDEDGFHSIMIPPESGGKYAFWIQKIEGDDCLESETAPFSEEEALSIVEAVQTGFAETPAP